MIAIRVVVGLSSTAMPGAGTCAGIDGARAAGLSDQWEEVRSQQDFLKVLDAGNEERKDLCWMMDLES